MASDLLSIAASGARVARRALDVTAQNIANASSEGYVRRTARIAELTAPSVRGEVGGVSLSGARLEGVVRNVDLFRLAEARRTTSDAQRANSELTGLENIQASIENARVFDMFVDFEASLEELTSDPTDLPLRASVIEQAQNLAGSFNVAANSLNAAGNSLHFDVAAGIDEVNLYTQELARINLRLARSQTGSTDQSSLLDRRDLMLQKLSEQVDIDVSYASDATVTVNLGNGAATVVSGGTAATLSSTIAADNTISFDVGGTPVTLAGGNLAGRQQALVHLRDYGNQLDTVAADIISTVNAINSGGSDLNGNAGQAVFTGTSASDIGVAISDPALIATAPAGSPANSRDDTNLLLLRDTLNNNGVANDLSGIIFSVSATVSSLGTTRDALEAIQSSASIALQSQSGVDLDKEAVDLIRFQQAFQASSRAMQVASNIFDTLINLR